jgi:hypothetical protein
MEHLGFFSHVQQQNKKIEVVTLVPREGSPWLQMQLSLVQQQQGANVFSFRGFGTWLI